MQEPWEQSALEEGGEVGLVRWWDFVSEEPFAFEAGAEIPELRIRYETYGKLDGDRSNVILICHALSGDHHCAGIHSLEDRKTGWWNNMIGPGKAIDTNRFFVVCSNCVGGCSGSVGPSSINPRTGEAYGLEFPPVTIADMVHAQERLLRECLRIDRLYAVIGGSMGGMQALQWAISYPDKVERVVGLATTARQNAQAIAFNEVGRAAIVQDPSWNQGRYGPDAGPDIGLAIARMMAHITYLSDRGMDEKFGRERVEDSDSPHGFAPEFQVESYLHYQGRSFINRFDANSYLYLTKALDRFDLYGDSQDLARELEMVRARFLVIGFSSDWLFPPKQNREVVEALLRARKNASYAEIDMSHGHDSFLVRAPELYEVMRAFLSH